MGEDAGSVGSERPHLPPISRVECPVAFRPVVYLIHIERTRNGMPWGLELGTIKNVELGNWTSGGLLVNHISGGLVREYNWCHAKKVRTGDTIVEVNSVRGSAEELLEKMEDEMVLELRLLPPQSGDDDDLQSN